MTHHLKIGQFSKFSQVSVKTLRYYDEMGLLQPDAVDTFTGYRLYAIEQLPRLNRILALKDLGLSLEVIRQLLQQEVSPEQLRGMLQLKKAELEHAVEESRQRILRVETRLKQIEQEHLMSQPDVIIKKVQPTKVAAIHALAPSYSQQGELWAELLSSLGQKGIQPCGPALTVYFDKEYKEQDVDLLVAAPIQNGFEPAGRVQVMELPAVEQMACLLHVGPYDTFSSSYIALTRWIQENGLEICGPNREVYLVCPDNTGEASVGMANPTPETSQEYLTEVQFPVRKA